MLDWWKRLSRIGKAAGVVAAISGAIVSGAAAWPIIEWVVPAHRGYARALVDPPVILRMAQIELRLNEGRRERLLDEAGKREIELKSDQAQAAPQYRTLVQERINRIKSELDKIECDNAKLRGEKCH